MDPWRRATLLCLSLAAGAAALPSPAAAASMRPGGFAVIDRLDRIRAEERAASARWRTDAGRDALVAASGLRSASAATTGRLLVGARTPAELPAALAALPAGSVVADADPTLGVASVVGDAAAIHAALAPRVDVAFVEHERARGLRAEPLDSDDPDTGRPYAWHLDAVHADAAQALVRDGRGAPVGIIDTGADASLVDLSEAIAGSSSTVGGDPIVDEVGHGTFVAGIVGARVNGHGTRGVAGHAPLLVAQVNRGSDIGTLDATRGIVWAVDHGARVVNLSYSGGCPVTSTERRGLAYALANDVVIVAAAGNEAETGNPVECPAAWLGGWRGSWSVGLSVGATTPTGRRAPFSSWNGHLSLSAPGGDARDDCKGVLSTVPAAAVPLFPEGTCPDVAESLAGIRNRWAYSQGTSFAAPVVAATASLVRRARPRLRAEQVADVVVRPDGALDWSSRLGFGIVDAEAAVRAALVYDTAPPRVRALRVRRVGARGLTVAIDARDVARQGEVLAGRGLEYRVDVRVGRRWARVYQSRRPPRGLRPLTIRRRVMRTPPPAGALVVRVRVRDDHLNVVRRVVVR